MTFDGDGFELPHLANTCPLDITFIYDMNLQKSDGEAEWGLRAGTGSDVAPSC